MANLPIYDPGGTVRTTPQQAVSVDSDAFGGAQARALGGVGNVLQNVGLRFDRLAEIDKQKEDASAVTDAATKASSTTRGLLYGPGGIYEQTGANAAGAEQRTKEQLAKVKGEVIGTLSTKEQKDAFDKVWTNYEGSTLDSVANFEFKQRAVTRTTTKAASLQNLSDDVIANYDKPDMLKNDFNLARGIIRSNADGLPQEALDALERQTISNMHLAIVQRTALDNPGAALDYYKSVQKEVNGVDHATAEKMIGQISRIRDVRKTVDDAINAGPANDIVSAVVGAESQGDPTAVSPTGAAGLMQLQPDTARETAILVGRPDLAQKTDSELAEYWSTPEGKKANVQIGRAYLGQQLQRFSTNGKADLEAALIAYNAGPANAEKWLNSGRDYDVLPKKEETLPYVQKVLGAWRNIDFSGSSTSSDIQGKLNGSTKGYFDGDARLYLKQKLQTQHGAQSVDGMGEQLADRVAAMMSDAPPFVQDGLDILSGYRDHDKQLKLFADELARQGGDVAKARKNVSPASGTYGSQGSQHEHGNAADLGWRGDRLSSAPKEVVDWVHANAASYGLNFPLGNENWHIETVEARKGSRPVSGNVADQRVAQAFGNTEVPADLSGDNTGYVGVAPSSADPANIYLNAASPFMVDTKGGSLEAALASVREKYSDDPDALAEAERQITNIHQETAATTKTQIEGLKKTLLQDLLVNGKSPRDADPQVLATIGAEGVKQLFSLEDDRKQGGKRTTDDRTYLELVQMTPAELRTVDLMEYAPKLSQGDLQKFADKQAEFTRKGNVASLTSSMQTRSAIVSSAANILGLKPEKETADAATLAQLNRRLDTEISAFAENNDGRAPNGDEIQKMVDGLMLQGKQTDGFLGIPGTRSGTTDMLFQVPPDKILDFYAASTVADIPPVVQPQVALTYKALYGRDPDETSAVNIYNDMIRVQGGGAPVPPKDFAAQIRQRFVQRQGRPPLPEEEAEIYKKTLMKAAASQNGK